MSETALFTEILGGVGDTQNESPQPEAVYVPGSFRPRNPLDRRRLAPGVARKAHTAKLLSDRHHEICRLALLGMKNVEIAKRCQCTPATVSSCLNSPIVRRRMTELHERRDDNTVSFTDEVKKRIGRSFEILDEALAPNSDVPTEVRLKEANNLLNRAEKVLGIANGNAMHLHAHLSADDIMRLKERAASVGFANGDLAPSECDTTCVEVVGIANHGDVLEGGDVEDEPIIESGANLGNANTHEGV